MVRRSGIDSAGKKALVLGSGGASVTVKAALEQLGADVTVISRSGPDDYDHLDRHADAQIIVNTTPVGMYPHNGAAAVDLRLFPQCEGVLDIVYNPALTALLLQAEKLNIPHAGGLSMLVAQAKRSSEQFTGTVIGDEALERVERTVNHRLRNIILIGMPGSGKSAVAAALVHKAIGDQLTCVFVDHGLLRKGEVEQVKHDFVAATGIRLITVDAADDFLDALAGVSEPERKRKIIGEKFIRTFEKAQRQVLEEAGARGKEVKFLVQGTLYPDVVESGGGDGAANIKSHHNVGGLPEDIKFQLIEPLRTLFKDEVRAIGTELGLPDEIVWRQPFPGPGLGIRIIGEITKERLDLLREADAIAREELSKAGLDRDIWQCPVVLLADVHSVGVQGDERTYGSPIVLRPVSSEDAMTADWSRVPYDVLATISTRITNECRQINRVVLDCTSKPPATIEWE